MNMDKSGGHGQLASSDNMTSPDMELFLSWPSYFDHPEHSGLMFAHIAFMVLAWIVLLPIAVMLSIARSRLTLPAQLVFLVVNGFGILLSMVYNHETPNLYENNSHHKEGWTISWIASVWVLMKFVRSFTSFVPRPRMRHPSLQPVTQAMAEYHPLNVFDNSRRSHDSGQGTEPNTNSLCDSPRTPSVNSVTDTLRTRQDSQQDDDMYNELKHEKRGLLQNSKAHDFFSRCLAPQVAERVFRFLYVVLERFLPILGFIGLITGLVVYGGICRQNHVFSGLAHMIKGGIFFWYGLLTFGRWAGSFADFGWAWNSKPGADVVGHKISQLPTMEFLESALICFYGATNVFLEHLEAWGKAWSATDLQHLSITLMFVGGGMLGMLVESPRIRGMVEISSPDSENSSNLKWESPRSYTRSLNPIPALIITLLGIVMSAHNQELAISRAIHKQWGTLLIVAAVARGITYITIWLKPPISSVPSRPPGEIIAAFCLVSGGLIFMASNLDSIYAMEKYNLNAMFVFTVIAGLTPVLMAWELVVLAVKGWAVRREYSRTYSICQSSAA